MAQWRPLFHEFMVIEAETYDEALEKFLDDPLGYMNGLDVEELV